MRQRIAIVGAGYTALRPLSPEVSFREMIYEAAVKAYADAGIQPQQVDTVRLRCSSLTYSRYARSSATCRPGASTP